MIEKMKKVTLLVSEAERKQFVSALREEGIIHIKQRPIPSSHEITFIEEKISKVENILNLLMPFREKNADINVSAREKNIEEKEEEIERLWEERTEYEAEEEKITRKISWFKIWGKFKPEELEFIKEKGANLRLYRLNASEYKKIKNKIEHVVTAKENGYFHIAVLEDGENIQTASFKEIIPPKEDPETLERRKKEVENALKRINDALKEESGNIQSFKEYKNKLEKEKEFITVTNGMQEEGLFCYLEGFCPARSIKKIISLAQRNRIGYLIEDPDDPDNTPTLITNPKWIRIISPVFTFMNTLPGYGEFDISLYFLVFFSLFFAMLIGDAGYGILFLAITFFARRKMKNIPAEPFFLMYLLSVGTIVWGSITGTWFGSEKIAALPFFNHLVIGKINSFSDTNQNFLIFICFVIGAVHLTIAHALRCIRMINSPKAAAEAGRE